MGKIIDLTGQRFGRLTVINRAGTSKHREVLWYCICDCGNDTSPSSQRLRVGKTTSCGCYHDELSVANGRKNALSEGESAKNSIYKQYWLGANKRNIHFALAMRDVFDLIDEPCHYCSAEPNNVKKSRNGNYTYNGIDRVDNKKGYIVENCVPCCKICNYAKRNMTYDDFLEWIENVYWTSTTLRLSR